MRFAIVEDDSSDAEILREHLLRFGREHGSVVETKVFSNAVMFLENYTANYDCVFMDIRMPYMNGMDAAGRLRDLDEKVPLVFITTLAQYAVKGYEVSAVSYLIKPVSYEEFRLKFSRVYARIQSETDGSVYLRTERGMLRLAPEEIAYCEVRGHVTVYHTVRGDVEQTATLKSAAEKLPAPVFVRCNHCYLVNLAFVRRVDAGGGTVTVEYAGRSDELQISRNKKKAFLEAVNAYLTGNASGNGGSPDA